MDYSKDDEELDDYLPKRTDLVYKEIESFESYELTNCVVYEMAIRNSEVKLIFKKLDYLDDLVVRHPYLEEITCKGFIPFNDESSNTNGEASIAEREFYLNLSQEIDFRKFEEEIEKLINIKKSKRYNSNDLELKNDELILLKHGEGEIDLEDDTKLCGGLYTMLVRYLHDDLVNNHYLYPKHGYVSNYEGADENYSHEIENCELTEIGTICNNGYNDSINRGFRVLQDVNKFNNSRLINHIIPNFKRKIHDPNQILTLVNFSLPINEIIDYVTHIKNTLTTNNNETIIKSQMELLGNKITKSDKTKNYPKIPSSLKFAHMFFIYDYIKKRMKYIEVENEKLRKEDPENYSSNKIDTKIVDIFEELTLKLSKYKISASTISNYYYAISPYIDEIKYPELLTEVSVESCVEPDEESTMGYYVEYFDSEEL